MLKKLSAFVMIAVPLFLSTGRGSAETTMIEDPVDWPAQCGPGVQPTAADAALQRMSPLTEAEMTPAQRDAAKKITAGLRGCIFGPFSVLQRSPEILNHLQMLGEYLRYKSPLPQRLREFAVLMTGRNVESPYVWYVHEPIALKSGVTRDQVEALAKDERPAMLDTDLAIVYDLMHDVYSRSDVADDVYARARTRFGEDGVVELVAINGYISLVGHELNTARTAVPASVRIPFAAPWEKKRADAAIDTPSPKAEAATSSRPH